MDTESDTNDTNPRNFYFPEALMQDEIADIARRVLWNPAKVASTDVQKLAAAVVAHLSVVQPIKSRKMAV